MHIYNIADISLETMQIKRQCNNIFKRLGRHNKLFNYLHSKNSFQNEGHVMHFKQTEAQEKILP